MIDTLDTAFSCGVTWRPEKPGEPTLHIENRPTSIGAFEALTTDWFALT